MVPRRIHENTPIHSRLVVGVILRMQYYRTVRPEDPLVFVCMCCYTPQVLVPYCSARET